MLSNAYFLAKFRFDTAENEPTKNSQNFTNFANFANPNPLHEAEELLPSRRHLRELVDVGLELPHAGEVLQHQVPLPMFVLTLFSNFWLICGKL